MAEESPADPASNGGSASAADSTKLVRQNSSLGATLADLTSGGTASRLTTAGSSRELLGKLQRSLSQGSTSGGNNLPPGVTKPGAATIAKAGAALRAKAPTSKPKASGASLVGKKRKVADSKSKSPSAKQAKLSSKSTASSAASKSTAKGKNAQKGKAQKGKAAAKSKGTAASKAKTSKASSKPKGKATGGKVKLAGKKGKTSPAKGKKGAGASKGKSAGGLTKKKSATDSKAKTKATKTKVSKAKASAAAKRASMKPKKKKIMPLNAIQKKLSKILMAAKFFEIKDFLNLFLVCSDWHFYLQYHHEWVSRFMFLEKRLYGHIAPVNVIAEVKGKGHFIFSAASDGKVRAWSTDTWLCQKTLNVTDLPKRGASAHKRAATVKASGGKPSGPVTEKGKAGSGKKAAVKQRGANVAKGAPPPLNGTVKGNKSKRVKAKAANVKPKATGRGSKSKAAPKKVAKIKIKIGGKDVTTKAKKKGDKKESKPKAPRPKKPPAPKAEFTIAVTALNVYQSMIFIGLGNGTLICRAIFDSKQAIKDRRNSVHKSAIRSIVMNDIKMFTASDDKTIITWSLKSLNKLKTYQEHTKRVTCLALSGNRLFSGSDDHNIGVWNWKKHKFECFLGETSTTPRALVGAAVGETVPVTKDKHTGEVTAMVTHGKRLFTSSWDCYVKIWRVDRLTCINSVFLSPIGICWTMKVRLVKDRHNVKDMPATIVMGVRDNDIEVRDLDMNLISNSRMHYWSAAVHRHQKKVTAVLPLEDGRIVTGSKDWSLKVWNVRGRVRLCYYCDKVKEFKKFPIHKRCRFFKLCQSCKKKIEERERLYKKKRKEIEARARKQKQILAERAGKAPASIEAKGVKTDGTKSKAAASTASDKTEKGDGAAASSGESKTSPPTAAQVKVKEEPKKDAGGDVGKTAGADGDAKMEDAKAGPKTGVSPDAANATK